MPDPDLGWRRLLRLPPVRHGGLLVAGVPASSPRLGRRLLLWRQLAHITVGHNWLIQTLVMQQLVVHGRVGADRILLRVEIVQIVTRVPLTLWVVNLGIDGVLQQTIMYFSLNPRPLAIKEELVLQLEILELLMLHLQGLLVSQGSLDVGDAHVIFVLVQVVVVLHDVALELLLGHLLVQEELHVLLLEHSPLEFHRPVAAHALDHDAVCLWREGHAWRLLQRLLDLEVGNLCCRRRRQHFDDLLLNQGIGLYL